MCFEVKLCLAYFSNSSREVLNKKLAEVVQGVELTSLQDERRDEGDKTVPLNQLEYLADQWHLRKPSES